MKKLIIARHGEYDLGNGKLNSEGIKSITALSEEILLLAKNQKVVILSSTAFRALDSAEIIGEKLGISFEKEKVLWSDSDHYEDFEAALNLIRSYFEKVDILILVTHFEYVDLFPYYFARKQLNTQIKSYPINKGSAWCIDCIKKTISIMNP